MLSNATEYFRLGTASIVLASCLQRRMGLSVCLVIPSMRRWIPTISSTSWPSPLALACEMVGAQSATLRAVGVKSLFSAAIYCRVGSDLVVEGSNYGSARNSTLRNQCSRLQWSSSGSCP